MLYNRETTQGLFCYTDNCIYNKLLTFRVLIEMILAMRCRSFLLFLCLFSFFLNSCFKDNDDELIPSTTNDINDFIWRGMNIYYLYKSRVPDLANDRFSRNRDYQEFISSFETPEAFFDALTAEVDEFSFLVDDYIALERAFDGITKNNGMEYGLRLFPDGDQKVFGYVRYILPDTDAAQKGVTRGALFTRINGIQLTRSNFRDLLGLDTYTVGFAEFNGTTLVDTEENTELSKTEYTENPVFITKVITSGSKKIGYLMYNSFNDTFEPQLNAAFAELQSEGITDLVLDLRYNGGGNVETAKDLASMITGQFNGDIFSTEEWNERLQQEIKDDNPERLINRFDGEIGNGDGINSLKLTQLYVITTGSSASASELVINGLDPYINVVKVGDTTRGKFQASITLYDSDNFRRQRADPGHTYAMQPLVLKSLNSVGVTNYFDGFSPDVLQEEDVFTLGQLGEENEPLLQAAIQEITGQKSLLPTPAKQTNSVGESDMFELNYQRMFTQL